MSFCRVPEIFEKSAFCFSATTRYIARKIGAGALIVCETVTESSGIPSKRTSKSARLDTATPHFPTSPSDNGESASNPIKAGRS